MRKVRDYVVVIIDVICVALLLLLGDAKISQGNPNWTEIEHTHVARRSILLAARLSLLSLLALLTVCGRYVVHILREQKSTQSRPSCRSPRGWCVWLILLAGICLVVLRVVWCGSFSKHWSPAGRTDLLPFEPAPQATEVKDVSAWKFLWPLSFVDALACLRFARLYPWSHLLAAHNASILPAQFLLGSIRVASVHVSGSVSVSDEIVNALNEGSDGHEEVSHDMDRDAVESH